MKPGHNLGCKTYTVWVRKLWRGHMDRDNMDHNKHHKNIMIKWNAWRASSCTQFKNRQNNGPLELNGVESRKWLNIHLLGFVLHLFNSRAIVFPVLRQMQIILLLDLTPSTTILILWCYYIDVVVEVTRNIVCIKLLIPPRHTSLLFCSFSCFFVIKTSKCKC